VKTQRQTQRLARKVSARDHSRGSPLAKTTLVAYGDFASPACAQTYRTVKKIQKKMGTTLRYVYRSFPQPEQFRHSQEAAQAAECASSQGKFWEMHDAIYQNQDRWTRPRPERVLSDLAQKIGVGMDQYEACINTGKYAAQIKANSEEGARRGVGSTPTFFFGRKLIPGAVGYDEFKANVDTMLAAAKAGAKKK